MALRSHNNLRIPLIYHPHRMGQYRALAHVYPVCEIFELHAVIDSAVYTAYRQRVNVLTSKTNITFLIFGSAVLKTLSSIRLKL